MADVIQRKQFTFYESFARALSRIKDKADRADAYDAICNYALYGIEPNFDLVSDSVAIAFDLIKPNLDASKRKAIGGMKGSKSKDSDKTEERPCEDIDKIPARPCEDIDNKKEKEGEKEKEKEIEKEKEYECILSPTPPAPEPPLVDYTGFSPRMIEAVENWLRYKQERRETYKPTGLKALVTEIRNNVAQYGEDAVIDLMGTSMASNWQGIIFDRLKSQHQIRDAQNTNNKGANTNGSTGGNTEPRRRTGTYL